MKSKIISPVLVIFFLLTSLSYSQTVYITKSGKKYHKTSCRHLSKSKIEIEIKNAKENGYKACKTCKPIGYSKSLQNTSKKKYSKSKFTSGRCKATTKKGTQCKRKLKSGSSYCWQHGG